ncbi:MAG: preprotein translocase subunit SecG [Desulfovibrio sp.]|uniref:preprotein translocase subunit SecG n=1 Tax=Desulfovibrio sp. TaxID=885 RepID=UPI001A790807|nr:preprotein translocase subunit SecG [Desulfovibrio sp.]MBD5417732.1 preprotein translocase subunit SecG [Desulfovibrio sp.]
MQTLILTLHIIVCVLLVILILLQSGKEGMGVIFGGGNTSVFGSSGAGGILAKLTTLMAIIFVITSLSYTYVTSARPSNESTILNVKIEEPEAPAHTAPAAPEAAAPKAPDAKTPDAKAPAAGAAPAEKPAQDAAAGTTAPQKP